MKKVAPGVLLEDRYPSVHLGVVVGPNGLLLVDSPLRVEDCRLWLGQLADYGKPRYLVLLDYHPDRVLGARSLEIPRLSHQETLQVVGSWADTFKGSMHPIGAEADHLKRVTGAGKAVPEVSFSSEMVLHLGDQEVLLWHRPGPTRASIWVLVPRAKVVFVGDTVTVGEPPYLGEANIDRWLKSLEELKGRLFRDYVLVSSRDGVVPHASLSGMVRFLQMIPPRLEKLAAKGAAAEKAAALAPQFMRRYSVPAARRAQVVLRLEAGLGDLYRRRFTPGK